MFCVRVMEPDTALTTTVYAPGATAPPTVTVSTDDVVDDVSDACEKLVVMPVGAVALSATSPAKPPVRFALSVVAALPPGAAATAVAVAASVNVGVLPAFTVNASVAVRVAIPWPATLTVTFAAPVAAVPLAVNVSVPCVCADAIVTFGAVTPLGSPCAETVSGYPRD
jgi:hypothetical protein